MTMNAAVRVPELDGLATDGSTPWSQAKRPVERRLGGIKSCS